MKTLITLLLASVAVALYTSEDEKYLRESLQSK